MMSRACESASWSEEEQEETKLPAKALLPLSSHSCSRSHTHNHTHTNETNIAAHVDFDWETVVENENENQNQNENQNENEEETSALSAALSSSPPHKRLRKAVSWDGLDPHNDNTRPHIVTISTNNNGSVPSLVGWIETATLPHIDDAAIDIKASGAAEHHKSSETASDGDDDDDVTKGYWSTDLMADTGNANADTDTKINNNNDIFRYDDSPPQTMATTTTTTSTTNSSSAANKRNRQGRQPSPLNYHGDDDFSKWEVGTRYKMLRILGRGSYGEVAQARDDRCDEFVAIKRIPAAFEKEEDSLRIFREMSILRRLRGHQCIILLKDVVQPTNFQQFKDLYLVFEFVDTDLYKLIMSPQYLTTDHIQTFLYQLLIGLNYIHSFSIIHRDLKPANILLNEDCSLKICDFGLSRIHHNTHVHTAPPAPTLPFIGTDGVGIIDSSSSTATLPSACPQDEQEEPSSVSRQAPPPPSYGLTRQLTKHVVTRWYRAPELILIQPYTTSVDIWSLGCILAELLSMQEGSVPCYQDRMPLFPGGSCFPLSADVGAHMGRDERLDQLSVIFSVIGTPCEEDVSSIGQAKEYIESLKKYEGIQFNSIYPAADPAALDLLQRMLHFNPKKRCTADEALEHDFVKSIRRPELEIKAKEALIGPAFLEAPKIDVSTLKRYTYEEVLHYKETCSSNACAYS